MENQVGEKIFNLRHDQQPLMIELLQEALKKSGSAKIKVTGLSMFPAVRSGESIIIQPVSNAEIAVGDIIFFHNKGRMYAHRVVKKDIKDPASGENMIITRGDTMNKSDSPVVYSRIIGKVIAVERRGKLIPIGGLRNCLFVVSLRAFQPAIALFFDIALRVRRYFIPHAIRFRFYRHLRRKFFPADITYRVYRDSDFESYARLNIDDLSSSDYEKILDITRHEVEEVKRTGGVIMVAEYKGGVVGSFQAGTLLTELANIDGWWLMGLYVKKTMRGLGIAENLTKALIEDAKSRGIKTVYCSAFLSNKASRGVFHKMGFQSAGKELEDKINNYFHTLSEHCVNQEVFQFKI